MSFKLNDISLDWVVPGAEPDGAEVMLWVSKAAMLASCAIAVMAGNAGAVQPWWVASGVKSSSTSASIIPALRKQIAEMVRTSGPAVFLEVFQHLIKANHPDVAVMIVRQFPELIDSYADDLLHSAEQALVRQANSIAIDRDQGSLDLTQVAHALHVASNDMLPIGTRKIWHTIVDAQRASSLAPRAQIALFAVLLRGSVAPVTWPDVKRRLIEKIVVAPVSIVSGVNGLDLLKQRAKQPWVTPHEEHKAQVNELKNTHESLTEPQVQVQEPFTVAPRFDALATRAGGMPMLLNLIHQTALPEVDTKAGTDVSLRVLHRFIARIPDAEAMQAALPALSDEQPQWASQTLPQWMPSVALLAPFSNRLLRFENPLAPGLYGFGLRGTNLLLGIGRNDDFIAFEALNCPLEISHTPFDSDIATALVDGMTLMLQRHLFALTGAGWRKTLRRLGYVAATATHIDVTLDLDDVHIAERMAGLDLTPGWVAWLGRVVTLHFEAFVKPGRVQ